MPPKGRRAKASSSSTASGEAANAGLGDKGCVPGPVNLAGLFQFPQQVYDDLFKQDKDGDVMLSRVLSLLRGKVTVTSDYSGMRCWEQALELCVGTLQKNGAEFPSHPLEYWRVCHLDPTVRRILLDWTDKQSVPKHVFGDINDRIPPVHRERLDATEIQGSTPQEKAAVYKQIHQYIYEHKHEIYTTGNASYCYKHNAQCPVQPVIDGPEGMKRPLICNGAGTTCCGWSTRNTSQMRGHAHPAQRPFGIWKCERAQVQDDFWFHENAKQFPEAEFQPPEGHESAHKHELITIVVGPEDLGWPI